MKNKKQKTNKKSVLTQQGGLGVPERVAGVAGDGNRGEAHQRGGEEGL